MSVNPRFSGELMKCVVCGAELRSQPGHETNWRCLEIDAIDYYACPAEFPPDGATKEQFKTAYELVFACCLSENLVKEGFAGCSEVEEYRASRRKDNHPRKSQGFRK